MSRDSVVYMTERRRILVTTALIIWKKWAMALRHNWAPVGFLVGYASTAYDPYILPTGDARGGVGYTRSRLSADGILLDEETPPPEVYHRLVLNTLVSKDVCGLSKP